jgi:hypothetical protein
LCGRFVSTGKLKFSLQELHKVLLLNWSANESRPSFVAQPIRGAKSFQGFTLADEMNRKTRGIKNI